MLTNRDRVGDLAQSAANDWINWHEFGVFGAKGPDRKFWAARFETELVQVRTGTLAVIHRILPFWVYVLIYFHLTVDMPCVTEQIDIPGPSLERQVKSWKQIKQLFGQPKKKKNIWSAKQYTK